MEEIEKLTVRVYGVLVKDNKLMFLDEMYGGRELIKLPGGGLELGEGARQTLEREFKEELNLNIEVKEHFYTQDFFIKSKLTPETQLLSIYYRIDCADFSTLEIEEKGIKKILWIPLEEIEESDITFLPVDKVVIDMLVAKQKQVL